MTERERLIELIDKALDKHTSSIENYVHPKQEWITDYLLANEVAANVVRCKDCKHCEKIIDQFDNDWYFCTETVNKAEVKPNDYCSYGERKDDK